MNGYNRSFFGMPPAVKNIIYINILMLLANYASMAIFNVDLNRILGIYFPASDQFRPIQILTHMFMHGGIWHLFFNMLALYMFGQILEQVWGSKRFLIYYFVSGLGAMATHFLVMAIQYRQVMNYITPEQLQEVLDNGYTYTLQLKAYTDPVMRKLQYILYTPTVGASGAIYGVLLAFGMLFPNTPLLLLFPPIPIRAKYFVLLYGGLELYLAITQPGSSVAHAAHLGGMIFGFILIKIWKKTTKTFY
ncbi:MAG TPA: rhomboid family intramembrane serine protease [Bacteroidales bacterium]|nr:rhomboid family intramembrane serine protease [Bacteroidales bacterium]HQG35947.1 rhomboid family intramembrane serine protease [Bacteroidales bacterium]HQG52989.1 rhomboid family intramembrane serine protease [Bacteroidales bacterium]HQJ21382.1 rhomboid family intramembrane serine protease [Bacteroidales bacterium]